MLKIKPGSQFKKDLKKFKHHRAVINELNKVLKVLTKKQKLPEKYQDHSLSGKWMPARECHIRPDVLLVYQVFEKDEQLNLVRLGSHSDLFS